MNLVRPLTERAHHAAQRGLDGLRRAWAAHVDLLRSNAAYEAAVAAAVARVIIQTSWERFIAAMISGLLAIYAAVRRTAGWPNPAFDEDFQYA